MQYSGSMAEHASQDIIIDAPVGFVLETILEIDEYPKWIADMKSVNVESRDAKGRPLVATLTSQALGSELVHTYEYDYTDFPHVIAWNLISGNMVSGVTGSYVIEELQEEKVCVTYDLVLELTAPLPGFIKKKATQKIISSALDSLKVQSEKTFKKFS